MINNFSFKTSGLSGDIIHQLAGIKAVCEAQSVKADIFVWLDRPCFLYEGAQHPYGNVMMNRYAFDMMKPLVEAQTYVNSFQIWDGQKIMFDLDLHREIKTQMPYGSLSRWIFYKYPDMTAKLHEPWLEVNDFLSGQWPPCILISRTSRYRNEYVSYFFLEQYRSNLFFIGLEEEHKRFQDEWKLELPHFKAEDFLHLTKIISRCKLFIGNQSMCFAIAEALKVPRILEVAMWAPNVIPTGPGAHDIINQAALTYLVDKLSK